MTFHALEFVDLVPGTVFRCRAKIATLKITSTTADNPNQRKNGVLAGTTKIDEAIPSEPAMFSTNVFFQSFISIPASHPASLSHQVFQEKESENRNAKDDYCGFLPPIDLGGRFVVPFSYVENVPDVETAEEQQRCPTD
jgi:hypothetical protein